MKTKHYNDLTRVRVFILCFLFLFPLLIFSQGNYLYINNNKYPATEYLEFQDASVNHYRSIIYVRLAYKKEGAYIELACYSPIRGPIKIYDEDGDFIYCNDYGIYDKAPFKYSVRHSTIYKLTKDEIEHLMIKDIDKIRFDKRGTGNFALASFDYLDTDYKRKHITTETADIIKKFFNSQASKEHDFNALFGEVNGSSQEVKKGKNKKNSIKLKPNHAEAGRKYGNKREPEISGQINTMTIEFSRNNVKVFDDVEQSNFEVVDYEWMDNNKLWIDFSTKPLELYMVIVFDIDGLVFVNNENDPQPGEQYKSLYFKELNKNEFKIIYK